MEEDKRILPLKSAYPFGTQHGLQKEMADIQNMIIEWDSSYTSSLRRGYIVELFEAKSIMAEFIEKYWPTGKTAWGQTKMRSWKRIKERYLAFLAGRGDENGNEVARAVAILYGVG